MVVASFSGNRQNRHPRPCRRETEDDPPIRAHGDSPKALQSTFQRMKPKARAAQSFDGLGGVEGGENFADTFHQLRRKVLAIVVLVKTPQPLMSKTFDHRPSVV
jgi:hypothetical protein